MAEKAEVSVTGSTTLPAVDAHTFSAAGSTTVDEDVDATDVDASGSLEVGGSVRTERFEVSGSTRVRGDLDGARGTASGSIDVAGATTVDHLETSGSATLSRLEGGTVESSGTLTAETIEVEAVEASGVVEADRVEAGEFSLDAQGDSSVETLVADEVRVERSGGLLGLNILSGSDGHLDAGEIRGEQVAIEATTADRVVGDGVRIGPDCEIGTLEAERAEVADGATVAQRVEPGD